MDGSKVGHLVASSNHGTDKVDCRCYESYFSSYLQVVYDQSVENAGYINNIYSLGASVFGLIVAWYVRNPHFCVDLCLSPNL